MLKSRSSKLGSVISHTSVISAHRSLRQEECKLGASLGYTARLWWEREGKGVSSLTSISQYFGGLKPLNKSRILDFRQTQVILEKA